MIVCEFTEQGITTTHKGRPVLIPFGGDWRAGKPLDTIQTAINRMLIATETDALDNEEDYDLRMSDEMARDIARCPEFVNYCRGAPDALEARDDDRNPNKQYGLTPYFYGLRVHVIEPNRTETLISVGIPIKADELREAAGLSDDGETPILVGGRS